MRGAILNPVKFYDPTKLPDHLSIFPNLDNTTFGASYIYGLRHSDDFLIFHIGVMYLQFETEISDNKNMLVYKRNANNTFDYLSNVPGLDVSPVGWVGKEIYKYNVNLSDGMYYLSFPNGYRSDYFYITSNTWITKELVKIKYANSENDYGCIFGENYFTAYLRGQLLPDQPKNEIDGYEDEEAVKLASTLQDTAILNIIGVHQNYVKVINRIFALDTVEVNGVGYENLEAPQWSPVDGGDVGTVTVKLIEKDIDHYWKDTEDEVVTEVAYAVDYNGDYFTDYNGDRFTIDV